MSGLCWLWLNGLLGWVYMDKRNAICCWVLVWLVFGHMNGVLHGIIAHVYLVKNRGLYLKEREKEREKLSRQYKLINDELMWPWNRWAAIQACLVSLWAATCAREKEREREKFSL